jgi:hypothetical protein
MMASQRGRDFLDELHQASIEGDDESTASCCSLCDSDDDDSMFDEEYPEHCDDIDDEAFTVVVDGSDHQEELSCVGDDFYCEEDSRIVTEKAYEDTVVPVSDTPNRNSFLSRYSNDPAKRELLLDYFERRFLENALESQRCTDVRPEGDEVSDDEDGDHDSSHHYIKLPEQYTTFVQGE